MTQSPISPITDNSNTLALVRTSNFILCKYCHTKYSSYDLKCTNNLCNHKGSFLSSRNRELLRFS